MAYITGAAGSMSDLKTALENAAVAAGWTLSSGILSKNGCFFQLVANQVTNPYLQLNGGTSQTGATLNGQPTSGVRIASASAQLISFPLNYEIYTFSNPDEIYCTVNYNSDFYQNMMFGKSDIPGIGGTGAWFCATYNSTFLLTNATNSADFSMSVSQSQIYANNLGSCFFENYYYITTYVHTGLDTEGWRNNTSGTAGTTGLRGISYCASLLTSLPNLSNQATILLPVKGIAVRFNGGKTIVANPKNVRYCRIDNVTPGEIITFGPDQWKVYPFFRKDILNRNGLNFGNMQQSGTFAYAIRYTGA